MQLTSRSPEKKLILVTTLSANHDKTCRALHRVTSASVKLDVIRLINTSVRLDAIRLTNTSVSSDSASSTHSSTHNHWGLGTNFSCSSTSNLMDTSR